MQTGELDIKNEVTTNEIFSEKYYLYQHRRLDTDEVFYIGIGKEDDGKFLRSKVKRKSKRTEFWRNIIEKTPYKIEIVYIGLTKDDACTKEKELISLYGRRDLSLGTLVNMTDGGETAPNLSAETKLKISNSLKGKKLPEETKNKMKESATITWNSPEYAKQREIQRERSKYYHELGVIGMKGKSSPKKGKPFSGDKEKLSKSLKEYWKDPTTKDNMAIIKNGKPFNVYKLKDSVPGKGRGGKRIVTKGDLILHSVNIAACGREFNIERNHIRRCLHGELQQVKGYIFEYEN